MMNFYLSGMIFFCGSLSLGYNNKHLLCMLLGLELLLLSVFFLLCSLLSLSLTVSWILMVYLFMGICEGVLGVGLLVLISRSYGGDYFFSMNILV